MTPTSHKVTCKGCKAELRFTRQGTARVVKLKCPKCGQETSVRFDAASVNPGKQSLIPARGPHTESNAPRVPPIVSPCKPYTCEVDKSGAIHTTWATMEGAFELLEVLEEYWEESTLAMRALTAQSRQVEQQYRRNSRSTRGSMYGLARGNGVGHAIRWLQFLGQTASGVNYAAASRPIEDQIAAVTNLQISIQRIEIEIRRWIRSEGGKAPRARYRN